MLGEKFNFGINLLFVLDLDVEDAKPVHLDHEIPVQETCHAFLGRDGQLRIVQSSNVFYCGPGAPPEPLVWHTINADTGDKVSILTKYCLPRRFPLSSIHHESTHQVLAMIDPHTLAILEAETWQDLARISLPSHLQASPSPAELQEFVWSMDGSMLAVSLIDDSDWPAAHPEVRIYNCLSGQCLQTLVLKHAQLPGPTMQWSCQNLLLVSCLVQGYPATVDSSDQPAQLGANGAGGHGQPGQVPEDGPSASAFSSQVLDPAGQTARVVPCFQPGAPAKAWHQGLKLGHWTPCGTFLEMICKGGNAPLHGELAIVDPTTMQIAGRLPHSQRRLAWAMLASPEAEGRAVLAFEASTGVTATFSWHDGLWHSATCKLDEPLDVCQKAEVSPDGTQLVASSEVSCRCDLHVYHVDVSGLEHPEMTRALQYSCRLASGVWPIAWADFPTGWPQLYAFVHSACKLIVGNGPSYQQTIYAVAFAKLARGDNLIGNWTEADLEQQAEHRERSLGNNQKSPQGKYALAMGGNLKWSPNGKHLAVRTCGGIVYVMSLRQA